MNLNHSKQDFAVQALEDKFKAQYPRYATLQNAIKLLQSNIESHPFYDRYNAIKQDFIAHADPQYGNDPQAQYLWWKEDQRNNEGDYKEIIEQVDQLAELEMELQELKKIAAVRQFEEEIQQLKQIAAENQEREQKAATEKQKLLELEKIEKEFIDRRLRQEETIGMKLFDVVVKIGHFIKDVSIDIVKPISLAFTGLVGFWDAYRFYRDKRAAQRKTKMSAGLFNALTSVGAIAVIFAAAANPIILAVLAVGTMAFGLYKESYITHQARKAVRDEKNYLRAAEGQRRELIEINPGDPRITSLDFQIKRHNEKLINLRENRFQAKRKVGFSALTMIGGALALGGLFFPPLALVGVVFIATSALIDAVDKRTNSRFSRWIARIPNRIKKSFKRSNQQIASALVPQPEVKPAKKMHKAHGEDTAHVLEEMAQHKMGVNHVTPAVIQEAKKIAQSDIDNLKNLENQQIKSSHATPLVNLQEPKQKVSERPRNKNNDDQEGEGETKFGPRQ